jgi:hypothetical protein
MSEAETEERSGRDLARPTYLNTIWLHRIGSYTPAVAASPVGAIGVPTADGLSFVIFFTATVFAAFRVTVAPFAAAFCATTLLATAPFAAVFSGIAEVFFFAGFLSAIAVSVAVFFEAGFFDATAFCPVACVRAAFIPFFTPRVFT